MVRVPVLGAAKWIYQGEFGIIKAISTRYSTPPPGNGGQPLAIMLV
jgi:hypothetical protein